MEVSTQSVFESWLSDCDISERQTFVIGKNSLDRWLHIVFFFSYNFVKTLGNFDLTEITSQRNCYCQSTLVIESFKFMS